MNLTTRRLFVTILFLGIFFCALHTVTDPDFFWHLRTGQLIMQTRAIPAVDPFSYTANGNPWVTHEWLSELSFYGINQLGGFGAIILTIAAILTAVFVFIYRACPDSSKPYVAGFSVLLGAITAAPAWEARPQTFSLLFFSIFLFHLERYRSDHRLRNLIPLPILMILWANFHGGFIFGVALIGIYIAGPVIDILWDLVHRRPAERASVQQVLTLAVIFFAALLAILINPSGYRLLLYPFQALNDASLMTFITEFESPDFHQAMWLPLLVMILLLVISAMKRKAVDSTTHVLLIASFLVLAMRSQYHVAFFALAATPVLATQFDWIGMPQVSQGKPRKLLGWLNALVVVLLAAVAGARFVSVSAAQPVAEADKYPEKAVDWILQTRPAGNLFNSFNWGGYLIWRLYPDYPVYIDGRPDMYGPSFVADYAVIYYAYPGWQAGLDEKDIDIVMIEPDVSLASVMRQSVDWKVAYEDANSVVFIRD